MRIHQLLVAAGTFLAAPWVLSVPAQVGPTVREVVEFRKLLQPSDRGVDAFRALTSPDGTRAVIVTRKADVATDKNRYEIQVLHVSPQRLAESRAPAPEVVFSVEVADDGNGNSPALGEVRWWDDRSLLFKARLKDARYQVYRLDVPKRELVQLTQETHPIVSFAASRDLRRLVYAVQVPNPPLKEGARSVVVGNQSFWSVKFGQQQLSAQLRKYRYFVVDLGTSTPPRPLGEAFDGGNGAVPIIDISPDGRWALLPRYDADRTLAWARQDPMLAEVIRKYGPGASRDPLGYFSGAMNFKARRMSAWNLDQAKEQIILDAPDDALPHGGQDGQVTAWQATGASVVLAGTHLPITPGGNSSTASHVIEYWPDSGRWQVVAKLVGRLRHLVPLADGFAVVDDGRRRRFKRADDASWQEGAVEAPTAHRGWTLDVREGLNQPPDVFATAADGRAVRLTTLNPQFDATTWGVMKPYSWRDPEGRRWRGGLMAGSATEGRRRLPLVIQSYGFAPDRFYLDGSNRSGGGFSSAFAGRAFLREGILVLALPMQPVSGRADLDYRGLRMFEDAVRGAVNALVKDGRVDPQRVGIIGWSATGEMVLNLVTFSKMPIQAATLADGDENSVFSYTLTYGFVDSTWKRKEANNQGLPYGPTLARWVGNDPALNTHCVKSAVRIETYGQSVKNNWDIYALLRRQYKPVEMIVIPGGGHALMMPSERMISLQGNVDWYRFWLKGEQRLTPVFALETEASLRSQYQAWQQMRVLKAADDARPRCERQDAWR